jgi:toxin FitB
MKGWLLGTNVIASLTQPNGMPSVKSWAAKQDEERLWLSVLTFAEYDKGIANLNDDNPNRARYMAARDALEQRFSGRIVFVTDPIVRRWGGDFRPDKARQRPSAAGD